MRRPITIAPNQRVSVDLNLHLNLHLNLPQPQTMTKRTKPAGRRNDSGPVLAD